jgi:ankyrin repeat protein
MKRLLVTTIAAVLLVGCGESKRKPTSILDAVDLRNIEAVKQYITAGTDVNTKDAIGTTPLLLAVTKGQKEIVELLIAEGADVNAKMKYGWTPLYFAAFHDYKEIAELLIATGADVNAKDDDGTTPLDMADDKETADLLRKHGGKTGEELKAEGK